MLISVHILNLPLETGLFPSLNCVLLYLFYLIIYFPIFNDNNTVFNWLSIFSWFLFHLSVEASRETGLVFLENSIHQVPENTDALVFKNKIWIHPIWKNMMVAILRAMTVFLRFNNVLYLFDFIYYF